MAATDPELRNEPTGQLVSRVVDSLQALIDRQFLLIKQEIREDIGQVLGATKTLAIGVGLLMFAALCFLHFLFLGINNLTGGAGWGWLAALLFTLVFGVLGVLTAKKGVGQVKVNPLARTRETLKEDAEWARHRLTPNGRSSSSETTYQPPSPSSSAEPATPST